MCFALIEALCFVTFGLFGPVRPLSIVTERHEKSEYIAIAYSLKHLSGAVAQLGERLHGMQEVVSSNLISSIL